MSASYEVRKSDWNAPRPVIPQNLINVQEGARELDDKRGYELSGANPTF